MNGFVYFPRSNTANEGPPRLEQCLRRKPRTPSCGFPPSGQTGRRGETGTRGSGAAARSSRVYPQPPAATATTAHARAHPPPPAHVPRARRPALSRIWNSAPKRRAPTRTKARNRTADGPELTPHYSSNSHHAYPQDFAAPIPRIGARLRRNAKQYPVRARWNRLGLKDPTPI